MQAVVLQWPRAVKRAVVLALDVVLALLATWFAYSLRFETPHWPSGAQWLVYPLAPALSIPLFAYFGLYRAIFRYSGRAALQATATAVGLYAALLSAVLLWVQWPMVPRSLGLLQPLIFLFLVGASRAVARFWLAELARGEPLGRVLIYGAGAAGVQTAVGLEVTQLEVVGFADDDPAKVGRSINGLPVIAPAGIADFVQRQRVTDILLALPSAPRGRRAAIVQALQPLPVHVRTLPGLEEIASGRVRVQDIQELAIEDLLGRDPVPPDPNLLARDLRDQVVLVTGAGGSIGSELCRQILPQSPRRLVLLEHSEYALYAIHQELQSAAARLGVATELTAVLASVTNPARLEAVFAQHLPHTVYHAAAYKHVPLVEDNPIEGARNNVLGTWQVARAALMHGVARCVLISTDKAVRPTNVMGATKRMAELILQALARDTQGTCFSMVRFGNVLGSSGSVVPLFRQQIAAGGPVTVTHAEVTRYFMTIPEAAQLVLQAGAMAEGGEVFVLDMGEPVRIIDLARRMIELSGLRVRDAACPDGDITIEVTGLRPGEKLYEELLIGDDPVPTVHPRILKAREAFLPWSALRPLLEQISAATESQDVAGTLAVLATCVQGFKPSAPQPDALAAAATVETPGSSPSS